MRSYASGMENGMHQKAYLQIFWSRVSMQCKPCKVGYKLKTVILGVDVKHLEHNAALDASFLNRNLVKNEWKRSQKTTKDKNAGTAGVNMLDLEPGSFGAFEFGEE